jgi:hypothetical protein
MTVVTLDSLDGEAKLRGNKGKKIDNMEKKCEILLQRKSPHKV